MNQFYSRTFTLSEKKISNFLNVLIPESETNSQNKNVHNPVSKTGDLEKSPVYLFQQKENKKLGLTIQPILSVSFSSVPGCGLCGTRMAHESLIVQIKWTTTHKDKTLFHNVHKNKVFENTQIFKGMKTLLFCCWFCSF